MPKRMNRDDLPAIFAIDDKKLDPRIEKLYLALVQLNLGEAQRLLGHVSGPHEVAARHSVNTVGDINRCLDAGDIPEAKRFAQAPHLKTLGVSGAILQLLTHRESEFGPPTPLQAPQEGDSGPKAGKGRSPRSKLADGAS